MTKDATVLRPVSLPSGVSSVSVSQITMNVTLGKSTTKTIESVPIHVKNNVNHYKASQPDNITTVSVEVSGTEDNIAAVSADMINVYIDMKDATPGLQTFELKVEQPTNGLVSYKLKDSTYSLNVLGETDDSAAEGGTINNE